MYAYIKGDLNCEINSCSNIYSVELKDDVRVQMI